MHLYRTQRRILEIMNGIIVDARMRQDLVLIRSTEIISKLGGGKKNRELVARGLAALSAKKYIAYVGVDTDMSPLVKLTDPGLNSLSTWEFVKLQNASVNSIVTLYSTALVAIAAVIALWLSSIELMKTRELLNKAKEEYNTQSIILQNHSTQLSGIKDSITSHGKIISAIKHADGSIKPNPIKN